MKWIEGWKNYKPDKPKNKKRRRVTPEKTKPKGKIEGQYCMSHEAKERWKHVNERPY